MSEQVYRKVGWILAAFGAAMLPFALTGILLVLHTTANYIVPSIWIYDRETGMVSFTRTVHQDTDANWSHEITLADGTSCSASGESSYRVDEKNPAEWKASPSLVRCLNSDQPYVSRIKWSALLWGVVPLRPVRLTQFEDPKL